MGVFDEIKKAADGHEEQINAGIDQVGDQVDARTGGQHAAQVDQAQDFLKGQVAEQLGQPAPGAPQAPPA